MSNFKNGITVDGKIILQGGTYDDLLLGDGTKTSLSKLGGENYSVRLISGDIYYSGNDLTYNFTDLEYIFFGVPNTISSGTITLSNGDTDPRFDIIAIDSASNSVVVLKGMPNPNPASPSTNLSDTQFLLSLILIPANATSISLGRITVYDENAGDQVNL